MLSRLLKKILGGEQEKHAGRDSYQLRSGVKIRNDFGYRADDLWYNRREAIKQLAERLNEDTITPAIEQPLRMISKGDEHPILRRQATKILGKYSKDSTPNDTQKSAIIPKSNSNKSVNLDELVHTVVDETYNRGYRPNIFYAQSANEFGDKLKDHFERAGEQVPEGFNSNGCFYSGVLKQCLIHPDVVQFIEGQRNDYDVYNKLKFFEYVTHEVTHGLVDDVRQGNHLVPSELKTDEEKADFYFEHRKPLEEYAVSMSAHQLTVDYADQITGGRIIPGLFDVFIKQNRASSLTPEQDTQMRKIFSRVGQTDEDISRYFIERLNSREGLGKITAMYLQSQNPS